MIKNVLCLLLLLISTTALRAEPYVVQNRNLDPAFWSSKDSDGKPFLSTVKHLVGAKKIEDTISSSWKQIDASNIKLSESYLVRTYFVGEDTDTRDSLYLGGDNPLVLFPNVSTPIKYSKSTDKKIDDNLRTPLDPLFPGDFVDLGRLEAGTNLDFSLLKGDTGKFVDSSCSDMVAFAEACNPYVLICYKCNVPDNVCGSASSGNSAICNTIFAIGIGENNVNSILNGNEVPAPEPLVFIPVVCAGVALTYMRRKRA